MAISILICGEGPTDVGKENYTTHEWIDGPAIAFVRSASHVVLDITGIEHKRLFDLQKLQRTKSRGHAIKAERLAKYAEKKKYQVAICYIDCDSRDDKEFNSKAQAVRDGFANSGVRIKCIPMIPKAMIENWLLADEGAHAKVFQKAPSKPPLPSHPEEIWGKDNDPTSNHPKCFLRRVLKQYQKISEGYLYDLALHSKPETLKQKCPVSYSSFFNEMQKISDS